MNVKSGYWSTHEYRRHSVERDMELIGFIGWKKFEHILDRALEIDDLMRNLILTTFKLGGRISEVLEARREMFRVVINEETGLKVLVVTALPLGKRYKKIGERIDEAGRKHFITEKINAFRTFGIHTSDDKEPFSEEFMTFALSSSGLLFPSRYRSRQGLPFTRTCAYLRMRKLGKLVNMYFYNHLLRAFRASQLRKDYGWKEGRLMEFFKWTDFKTASIYTKAGVLGLVEDMERKN